MRKEELNKRYYHLPNEIMQLGLSVGEIAVYNYLKYCEDRKTYQCYPSYRKIGEALSISKKTVYKYVKSLEKKQLISTEPTTGKKKRIVLKRRMYEPPCFNWMPYLGAILYILSD